MISILFKEVIITLNNQIIFTINDQVMITYTSKGYIIIFNV